MNLSQYLNICKNCDAVLDNKNISNDKYFISWLYVLSEHPQNLEKYKNLFVKKNNLKTLIVFILIILKNFLKAFFLKKNQKYKYIYNAKIDTLFISHLPNKDYLFKHDFYFGEGPEFFKKSGEKVVVLLHNQSEGVLREKYNNKELVPKILIPNTLSLSDEIEILKVSLKLLFTFNNLYKSTEKKKITSRNIYKQCCLHSLSPDTINNIRFSLYLKNFMKFNKPKKLFVSFEGHAWERIAFNLARQINRKITCIGYQHAILFPNQHSIKRKLGGGYDPDIILCSGLITKRKLEKYWRNFKVPCYVWGSARNLNTTKRVSLKNKFESNTCLVAPDGTLSECKLIFKFAIQSALNHKELNFIFRLHPTLSFNNKLIFNIPKRDLPSNIVLSKNTLEHDLLVSRWIIYRASGVVIKAVLYGLRPLYFSVDNEINVDPLYNLLKWRLIFNSQNQFRKYIISDKVANKHSLENELLEIQEFSYNYQTKFNHKLFYELFKLHQ